MHIKIFYFLSLIASTSLCHAQILDQLANSKDDSPIVINADESVVCDETAQKCVATGKASAQKGTNTVYGDILTIYFTEGKDRDVTHMTADGHVRMESPNETAYGEHGHYDVKLDRVLMTGGNLKIITPKEILTARDSIEYWHTENKGIARGNAVATFIAKEEVVQGDTLVAYFKSSSEKTEDGKEKLALDRVEAEGNMLASGPQGVVTGKRGNYSTKTHMVEIFENVKVNQGGNIIEGEYGRHNLETNVAEIFTHPPGVSPTGQGKRISGLIIKKDIKKIKEKESESGKTSSQKRNAGQIFPTSAKKNRSPSP